MEVASCVPNFNTMAETISPSVKTTKAAIVKVVVGISAVMPGKPRTVACITTSTIIPASRRMRGGIIGRKSSIRLDCFDIMTTFSNQR